MNIYKNSILLFIIGGFLLFSVACKSKINPEEEKQAPDTYILKYVQDFDSLSKGGGTWKDNITIPGWWITSYKSNAIRDGFSNELSIWNLDKDSNYYANDGTRSQAGVLSLGEANSSERSLGSLSSNQYQQTFYFVLENNTEKTINDIYVSYTGEQWRTSANKTEAGVLYMSYAVLSSKPENMNSYKNGEYPFHNSIELKDLHFYAPQDSSGTDIKLDGNNLSNQKKLSSSFEALIPPGSYLLLKWFDPNENGVNSTLGIDNVKIICK